jgi:hypothetical protein
MLQPIDVDFEVYKAIQSERRGFDDSPNAALRRLLGLDAQPTRSLNQVVLSHLEEACGPEQLGGGWASNGVQLPNGTRLRMTYKGKTVFGVVGDNQWQIMDQRFSSPSDAACAVARSINGKHTSLNGWTYWEAMRPGAENWVAIDSMRPVGSVTRRS